MIVNRIIQKIKFNRFKKEFHARNTHNFMSPRNIFNLDNVSIGKYSYGELEVLDYGNENADLRIGNFCSIAGNVRFFSAGNHFYRNFSTYPFYAYFKRERETI